MKNKKALLWVILPVIVAIAAGVIIYAVTGGVVPLKMGENGVTLLRGSGVTLRAERVYFDEDGNAMLDYTVDSKSDSPLWIGISDVEINGWAMRSADYFADYIAVEDPGTGDLRLGYADILERAGITDIYDLRFEAYISFDKQQKMETRQIVLNVKDAPAPPAARMPVEDEQVIVDTELFTVIAYPAREGTAYDQECRFVDFYLHNKTDEVQFADVTVCGINDLLCTNWVNVELYPGGQSCLPVDISFTDLDRFGMTGVDKLSVELSVCDKDFNYIEEFSRHELFFNGCTADTLPEYVRTPEEGETVIFDDDRFSFVIFGAERFDENTYLVDCYIENKTDGDIWFSIEESFVNGVEVECGSDGYGFTHHSKEYTCLNFRTDASDTSEAVEEFRFTMETCLSDGESREEIITPDQWLEYVQ